MSFVSAPRIATLYPVALSVAFHENVTVLPLAILEAEILPNDGLEGAGVGAGVGATEPA